MHYLNPLENSPIAFERLIALVQCLLNRFSGEELNIGNAFTLVALWIFNDPNVRYLTTSLFLEEGPNVLFLSFER
jgi:hypothetical protein